MNIHDLISTLETAARNGIHEVYTDDNEIGVCGIRVVRFGNDGEIFIEPNTTDTDGEILAEDKK